MDNSRLDNPWRIGDIIFVRSSGFLGTLNIFFQNLLTARKYSKQEGYSHVILSLGDNIFVESNTDKGVHIFSVCELEQKLKTVYHINYKVFRNLDVLNNKELQRKIFKEAEYYIGQKYNILFLLAQRARIGHSYCSEFVSNVYKPINIFFKHNQLPRDIFPNHLYSTVSKDNDEWIEVTDKLSQLLFDVKKNSDAEKLNYYICSSAETRIKIILDNIKKVINVSSPTYDVKSLKTAYDVLDESLIVSNTIKLEKMAMNMDIESENFNKYKDFINNADSIITKIMFVILFSIKQIGEKYQQLHGITMQDEKDIRLNFQTPTALNIKNNIKSEIEEYDNRIREEYKKLLRKNFTITEQLNRIMYDTFTSEENLHIEKLQKLLSEVSVFSLSNSELVKVYDKEMIEKIQEIYKESNRENKFIMYEKYLHTIIKIGEDISLKIEIIKYFLNLENNLDRLEGILYLTSFIQNIDYYEKEINNDINDFILIHKLYIEFKIYSYISKMATDIKNKDLENLSNKIVEEKQSYLVNLGVKF